MKARVTAALAKADAIAQKYISGDIKIPKEDLLVLKKYEGRCCRHSLNEN